MMKGADKKMQHTITIKQILAVTLEVDAASQVAACAIGNEIVATDAIPLNQYKMIEASVEAEKQNNVIEFKKP